MGSPTVPYACAACSDLLNWFSGHGDDCIPRYRSLDSLYSSVFAMVGTPMVCIPTTVCIRCSFLCGLRVECLRRWGLLRYAYAACVGLLQCDPLQSCVFLFTGTHTYILHVRNTHNRHSRQNQRMIYFDHWQWLLPFLHTQTHLVSQNVRLKTYALAIRRIVF